MGRPQLPSTVDKTLLQWPLVQDNCGHPRLNVGPQTYEIIGSAGQNEFDFDSHKKVKTKLLKTRLPIEKSSLHHCYVLVKRQNRNKTRDEMYCNNSTAICTKYR